MNANSIEAHSPRSDHESRSPFMASWYAAAISLATVLALIHPSSAIAQTQTYPCETVIQFGTGTSTNGAKLRPGSVDPLFLGTDATFPDPPNTYVVTDPPAAWIADSASADSQWIGPSPSTADDVAGVSVYRLSIISPCSGATLTGRYAASDRGVLRLNGQAPVFPTPATGWTTWTTFSFNNLLPGLNRLEFYVTNTPPAVGGPPGPSGLRAELKVTATCCPCIELTCPSDILLTTCSNGAPANFDITGRNHCFTNLNITCSLSAATGIPVVSGFVFPVGTNTVFCNASDTAGHRTNCAFRVIVSRDSQPPQIRCPRDIAYLCSGSGTNVSFNVTATDDEDVNPIVTCVPPSGSYFPAGTNNVICEARDSCGRVSRCSFNVILAPNGFSKTLQAGVADNFSSSGFEAPDAGPCLGASGYWTGMPFDTSWPGRHLSHSFQGLPNNVSAAKLILHLMPTQSASQDDVLRIGLQNCGGPGSWLFAQPVATLPGAGGTWNANPPTTLILDLAALPGGVNLLANLNANHRLEFAVGTETMVDYAQLEVTYCGPQSTLSGVPYSLNNVYPIHQGDGVSWRTVNSNGPPPTVTLDVGLADGFRLNFAPSSAFAVCNPIKFHEGQTLVWPTGGGSTATVKFGVPGTNFSRTLMELDQPSNPIGKAIEVWDNGQLVSRYFQAGNGPSYATVRESACLNSMGFTKGYFFANFSAPESIEILGTGTHVSGQVGPVVVGSSVRLYFVVVGNPRTSKQPLFSLHTNDLTLDSISLLRDDTWIEPFGLQLLTITDVAFSKALLPSWWRQPYGDCSPAYGPWQLNLNGVAGFCSSEGSDPPVCNNGYVDVNLVEEVNFGGLRLTPTALPLDWCTIQNTVANSTVKSITVNRVSGGPLTINGATSLGSDAWPNSISGNSGPQSFTAHFPPNTTVGVNGQLYIATSATFTSQPQVLGQFYQVCIETTLLPQFSFFSFHTTGLSVPPACMTLECPTNVIVNSTNEAGTVVTFNPTGATRCGSNVVVTCEPPSGSFFPPGASVVHCSVLDSQGNQDQCGFVVTVNGPASLRLVRVGSDQFELRWTGDAVGEYSDILGDGARWRELDGTVEINGMERVLRFVPTGRHRFFRLRLPDRAP